MLNQEMDSVLLVKGWKKGANWSFPRGKINKNESDLDCAIREVYEETGFDIKGAGLASQNQDEQKFIEITMREQHMRLYVFRGAPMDFEYAPRTRKEISKIQWYKLSELPTLKKGKAHQDAQTDDLATNANKYYMVAPFLGHLKKWIGQQKKADQNKRTSGSSIGQLQADARAPENGHESVDVERQTDHNAGNMDRLLASLRQSEQTMKAAASSTIPKDNTSLGSGNLIGLLGLSSKASGSQGPPSKSQQPHALDNEALGEQKATSNDLLALLRGGPPSRPEMPPETPAEQLLQNPLDPPSPKLEHQQAHQHRPPIGPRPQAFPIFPSNNGYTMPSGRPELHMAPTLPHVNQLTKPSYRGPTVMQKATLQGPVMPVPHAASRSLRDYPPALGPGHMQALPSQRIPLSLQHQVQTPPINSPMTEGPTPALSAAKAPYQRTGDPDFARSSEIFASGPRTIPPASKLPPPKLTSHTSSLLSLFKAPAPPHELSSVVPAHSAEPVSTGHSVPQAHSFDQEGRHRETPDMGESKQMQRGFGQHMQNSRVNVQVKTSKSQHPDKSLNKAPPQILKKVSPPSNVLTVRAGAAPPAAERSSEVTSTKPKVQPPTSARQSALLNLFRKPSATEAAAKPIPTGPTAASLQSASSSFELSALPHTPGHSREPSAPDLPLKPHQRDDLRASPSRSNGLLPIHPHILRRPAHTSSATIDGPLNIPQFELIHQAKEGHGNPTRKKRQNQHSIQKSPVTILQRPSSKGVDGLRLGSSQHSPELSSDIVPKRLPSQDPPVTPRLDAKPSSSGKKTNEPFQPQILRRPIQQVADQDLTAPSPVSPLPSPKHPVLPIRHGNDKTTHQHKQSLLAMFSRPGPPVAPVSSLASKQPSMTNKVVSPLTSKQQDKVSLEPTESSRPDLTLGISASKNTDGSQSLFTNSDHEMATGCSSSGDGRATPRGVTPTDRNFLLNFLGDVARSGK